VLKDGAQLNEEDVKQFALKHAPAYQHPRFVWFVEKLPLSSTNKLDRATLKREAAKRIAN
jgi:acyl-CoA synthetase (AMP-forming)/AMP-acid ligase II